MSQMVTIPHLTDHEAAGPGWFSVVTGEDRRPCKPHIKCLCGEISGIGLHHVHADGRVTASFYHSEQQKFMHNGKSYDQGRPGCGWHVFLILADYHDGEFPPVP